MAGIPKMLVERGFRIVLLVPKEKLDYFAEEYGGENIEVVGIDTTLTKRDLFLRFLILSITHTKGLSIKKRAKYYADGDFFSYVFAMAPSILFRGARPVVALLRFLDPIILRSKRFTEVLEKYTPDIVFLTDLQNEMDVRLLHEAKKRNIKTVGMLRSWDNVSSKGLLRAIPEVVLVHNDILRNGLITQNHVTPSRVVKVGIPHYDLYFNPHPTDRKTFFNTMGLELEKPLVLFAPIGDRYIRDNHVDLVALEELSALDANVLVRLPPMDVVNLHGFKSRRAHVVIQTTGTRSWKKGRGDGASKLNEVAREDEQTLIDSLYYADVVVTGMSTVAIDASAFLKPIVLMSFDVDKRAYLDSVARYFDYEYYDAVHASGGVRFAKTKEELRPLVDEYLRMPLKDIDGRRKLVEGQAQFIDGTSRERLVKVLADALI